MCTRKIMNYMFGKCLQLCSGYKCLYVGFIDPQLVSLLHIVLEHELFPLMSIQIRDGMLSCRHTPHIDIDHVVAYPFGLTMHSKRSFIRMQLIDY
jgi:hypothetical protein